MVHVYIPKVDILFLLLQEFSSLHVEHKYIKGTQAWDSFDFFWPKSKPYMTLVKIKKN